MAFAGATVLSVDGMTDVESITEGVIPVVADTVEDASNAKGCAQNSDVVSGLSIVESIKSGIEHIKTGSANGEYGQITGAYRGGTEYEKARAHFDAAREELRRQHVDLLSTYGWFLYRTTGGELAAEGARMLQQANEQSPEDPRILSMLGYVALHAYNDHPGQTSNLDSAKTLLERAVALDPSMTFAYWPLSQIAATQNDVAASDTYMLKFVEKLDTLSPEFYLYDAQEMDEAVLLIKGRVVP